MGDSVPKHAGPISLTDTPLEPSISRTRPTTTGENPRDGKPSSPEMLKLLAGYKFCGSKPTPFFHIVKAIVAILRASVRRAIVGRIPFSSRAT
jgi:hypothetical protein